MIELVVTALAAVAAGFLAVLLFFVAGAALETDLEPRPTP